MSKLYELALPNKEVKVGLFGSLIPHYLDRNSAKGKTAIARMSVLIRQGKINEAMHYADAFKMSGKEIVKRWA